MHTRIGGGQAANGGGELTNHADDDEQCSRYNTDTEYRDVKFDKTGNTAGTDIVPITSLTSGRKFSTLNASGSTSQAASLVEAVTAGAKVLLLDEDTSATNFMIRDDRMRLLVRDSEEPITPYRRRIRDMYIDHGVSTVLVVGGSGDYFAVADCVLHLNAYKVLDVTAKAKSIAAADKTLLSNSSTLHNTGSSTLHNTGSSTLHNTSSSTLQNTGSSTLHNTSSSTLHNTGSSTLHNTGSSTLHNTGSSTLHNTSSSTLHNTGSSTL
eukprot:Lankesteria_metandrocarpae@DN4889_c2_g1_i2.p1